MQTQYLMLAGLIVVIALQALALLRRRDGGSLEQALREEARAGRGELRELVEAQARQQAERLDSFARNLIDLSTRRHARLDQLREALGEDARKARGKRRRQQRNGELIGARLVATSTPAAQDARSAAPSASSWPELVAAAGCAHGGPARGAAGDARKGRRKPMESQQRFADAQGLRLNDLTTRNEQRIGELRATLDAQLKGLQEQRAQARTDAQTVDESLNHAQHAAGFEPQAGVRAVGAGAARVGRDAAAGHRRGRPQAR
jgi:DNA recombination protein RmuC